MSSSASMSSSLDTFLRSTGFAPMQQMEREYMGGPPTGPSTGPPSHMDGLFAPPRARATQPIVTAPLPFQPVAAPTNGPVAMMHPPPQALPPPEKEVAASPTSPPPGLYAAVVGVLALGMMFMMYQNSSKAAHSGDDSNEEEWPRKKKHSSGGQKQMIMAVAVTAMVMGGAFLYTMSAQAHPTESSIGAPAPLRPRKSISERISAIRSGAGEVPHGPAPPNAYLPDNDIRRGLNGENIDLFTKSHPIMPFNAQWDGRRQIDDSERVHGISSQPASALGSRYPSRMPKREMGGYADSYTQNPDQASADAVIDRTHPWMETMSTNDAAPTPRDIETERAQLDKELELKYHGARPTASSSTGGESDLPPALRPLHTSIRAADKQASSVSSTVSAAMAPVMAPMAMASNLFASAFAPKHTASDSEAEALIKSESSAR